MQTSKRRGEAPLPLVLAGLSALTAIMVIVGGLARGRKEPDPPPQGGTKYIQTLEGVMERYGQRGSAGGRTDGPAGRPSGGTSGPPQLSSSAINQKMMKLVSSPDILLRRLGHANGDFVYSKQRGWLRFDPARGALEPMGWNELPEDLRERYPQDLFPSRGRTAIAGKEDRTGGGSGGTKGGGGSAGGAGTSVAAGGSPASGGRGADPVSLAGVGDAVVFRKTPILSPAVAP
jgi:hypothetical protein